MAWQINWTRQAFRKLSSMDQEISKRIVQKLEDSLEEPKRHFKRLKGHEDHKLRIGDYRLIAHLDPVKKFITVESIGHRRSIYKK